MLTPLRHPASRVAILIFLIALLIRLGLVISFPDIIPEGNIEDKVDRYDPIAMSLLEGKGFALNGKPTAIAGPGYPVFLAAIYALLGYSKYSARIFLSFIDAALPVIFYLIAKRHFGGLVPLLTASMLVFHPFFIYEVFSMSSETLFFFFHGLFILCFSWALPRRDARGFLLGGMLLGAATLCRAVSLLLPVATVPIFLLVYRAKLKTGVFHLATFLLGFTLVVAPWVARNYVIFQRFVPVQQLGGIHFYWASPSSSLEERKGSDHVKTLTTNPLERDRIYYEKAVERIKENPVGYLRLMGQRLLRMWYKTSSGRYENITLLANGMLLLFALPGIVLSRRKWESVLYLLVFVVYYVVLHMVTVANVRYSLPTIPMLIIFAMVTVDKIWSLRNRAAEAVNPPSPFR